MNYWLFKSEPDEISIDNLQQKDIEAWTGIRNYQARNFIRDSIKIGDKLFFYHSSCKVPAIVGSATVVSDSYIDPSAFDLNSAYVDPKSDPNKPRWYAVNIQFSQKFAKPLTLAQIKADPKLSTMYLVEKGSRLSIQPVTAEQWQYISELCQSISL